VNKALCKSVSAGVVHILERSVVLAVVLYCLPVGPTRKERRAGNNGTSVDRVVQWALSFNLSGLILEKFSISSNF